MAAPQLQSPVSAVALNQPEQATPAILPAIPIVSSKQSQRTERRGGLRRIMKVSEVSDSGETERVTRSKKRTIQEMQKGAISVPEPGSSQDPKKQRL